MKKKQGPERPVGKTKTVRIPDRIQERIDEGSTELGMSEQETIRISLDVGLDRLKTIGWKLASAVNAAADRAQAAPIAPSADQPAAQETSAGRAKKK